MSIIEYVLFMPIILDDIVGINAFYGQVQPKEQPIVHAGVQLNAIEGDDFWYIECSDLVEK